MRCTVAEIFALKLAKVRVGGVAVSAKAWVSGVADTANPNFHEFECEYLGNGVSHDLLL